MHITAAGVYSISGTLTDGCIDVDAKGKVYLEFDGVEITSSSGPALIITDAKKVTLTLVDGTTSYLTDAAADNEYDAALFTNDTLIINGAGTLVVTGNNNEGISSDDDIIINAGTVEVTAVDDGLNAHDDITITGGDVYIHAGGDGLDSNGTINISGGTLISLGSTAGGDGGLDAVGALTITGGFVVAGGNSIVGSQQRFQPGLRLRGHRGDPGGGDGRDSHARRRGDPRRDAGQGIPEPADQLEPTDCGRHLPGVRGLERRGGHGDRRDGRRDSATGGRQ